ncbi:homoserine kinase [Fodinibius saliphilus]|uniref:homoserine kinase n=1 Tax=Fodinibius saliphilus TaxID=1920650 RepID=UPI0014871E12|nr:homoserine kinase [Fodinibius saliphilus]
MSAGFANENYKLTTDRGSVLFRVVKQKDKHELTHELQLLDFLADHDFPAAYPLPQENGSYINDDEHLIVLYEFLEGEEPTLNELVAQEIGDAAGRLNALKEWQELERDNAITLEKCRRLIPFFTNKDAQLYPIFTYFEEETKALKSPLSTDLPTGIVHADLFTDNTVFKGDKLVGLIDFEEVCIDQLLFDVGIAINGFCYPNNKLNSNLLTELLNAYTQHRPLEPLERELLPWFIRWGAHSQIYWHLRYGLLDHPNKKQLHRVQELIQRVEWAREYRKELSDCINQCFRTAN